MAPSLGLFRATAGTEGVGEVHAFCGAGDPLGVAEGAAADHAELQGLFLGGTLWAVDAGCPGGVAGIGPLRPGGEEGALFGRSANAPPEAAPTPLLGGGDQVGAEGIAVRRTGTLWRGIENGRSRLEWGRPGKRPW